MPAAWRHGTLIFVGVFAGVAGFGGKITKSGEPGYWVKLRALSPDAGTLEPPFDEDGSDFKLMLDDTKLKQLRLYLMLDRDRYDNGFLPDILVNGRPLEFSALSEPNMTMKLNQNIGPYDKQVQIRVQDHRAMKGWFGFQEHSHHDYKIHIMQPPEFDKVVKATGIVVRDADGTNLVADAEFDPTRSVYHFDLEEAVTSVDVQANCTKYATEMMYNGRAAKSGSWLPVAVPGAIKTVLVQCSYFDSRFASSRYEQTYQLNFKRKVEYDDDTAQLSLQMLAMDGYCVMKEGASALPTVAPSGTNASSLVFADRALQLSWAEAEKAPPGDIVCRTLTGNAKLVPLFRGLPGARMSLHTKSRGQVVVLNEGHPNDIHISKGRQHYTLSVALGDAARDYNVTMLWPQACKELRCPKDKVLKAEATSTNSSAWAQLCLEETCSDIDVAHCCMNRASCGTFGFKCPTHHALRSDAEDVLCEGAECGEDEATLCCEPQATCNTFRPGWCGPDRVLAAKAGEIYCAAASCTKQDGDACCQDRATCSSYGGGCPVNFTLRVDAHAQLCGGVNCSKEDEPRCCEPKASCHVFGFNWKCPEGRALLQPPNRTMCSGDACSAEDSSICCADRARCSSFTCPAHSEPKPGSEQTLCKYSECSTDTDGSTCCDMQASCASSVKDGDCPSGLFLIANADKTFCVGTNCTKKEKAACCTARASCADFRFDCPVGHMHRLSSSKALCRAEQCDEGDMEACCARIPGLEELGGGRHVSAIRSKHVQAYLKKNPDAIRKVSGSWITGLEDRDCHSTCEMHGLVCTEAGLYAHNREADSEKEVLRLMKHANRGHLFPNYEGDCPDTFGTSQDVPLFWAEGCLSSAKKRPLSTFNCSATPVEDVKRMKHRLCYCHEGVSSISDLTGDPEESQEKKEARPSSQEQELDSAGTDTTREILELIGGLIVKQDCWHHDIQEWSSTKTTWCAQHHAIHVASKHKKSRYSKRSLVLEEGKSIGDFAVQNLDACIRKCDKIPRCHSFSFSADSGLARKGCNLKDKVVTEDEAGSEDVSKGDYKTYYKTAAPHAIATASERKKEKTAAAVGHKDAASSAGIQRLHAASVPHARHAGAWFTQPVTIFAVAASSAALALLALALQKRSTVRRFDRLPQPLSEAPPTREPLVEPDTE